MELTQQDFEQRMDRRDAGQASDEDARLIEHYEREGFIREPKATDTSDRPAGNDSAAEQGDAPMQFETSATAEVVPGEQSDAGKKTTARGKNTR